MNPKNMEKATNSAAVNTFMTQVDNLRNNAKCSQKDKIACFQQIADCIMSPAMESHINYATHCSTATNVLLLFCEDLDALVRMSAEENLNRIFRTLERTRVSRILMDLYGEIKRNGNQRSLRICLNLFAYYAPRIKEKHVQWYAFRLLHCLQTIAQRQETQLVECLCEFIKNFGKNLQHGLTDSETSRLFEVFIANIGVECAVKRRCSAQNCISLIENSRNKSLMAKHGLNKVIELLLNNQEPHSVLGALGFLRLLLPLIIRGFPNDIEDDDINEKTTASTNNATTTAKNSQPFTGNLNQNSNSDFGRTNITNECRQIFEIYDYCLHLLSTSNVQQQHSIINASLEVINAILQTLDMSTANTAGTATTTKTTTTTQIAKSLQQLLSNQQLQHNEHLRKRKSLKNQIFQQLRNYEVQCGGVKVMTSSTVKTATLHQGIGDDNMSTSRNYDDASQSKLFDEADMRQNVRHQNARSISECVDDDFMAIAEAAAASARTLAKPNSTTIKTSRALHIFDADNMGDDVDDDDFTMFSEINEPQQTSAIETGTLPKKQEQTYATTTRIDVENLIDAIDARSTDDNTKVDKIENEQTRNLLATTTAVASAAVAIAADDKSSQHLSDFDNESFNSIDFEAEIKIGSDDGVSEAVTTSAVDGSDAKVSSDAIGSFFNNLISHSSAASESVSKLFRTSSNSKMTPTKSLTQMPTDKGDAVSLTSVSVSATDSLSLISATSENKRSDVVAILEEDLSDNYAQRRNSNISESPADMLHDESYSHTISLTASTAVLVDSATRNTTAPDCSSNDGDVEEINERNEESHKMKVEFRKSPNVNPFLLDTTPLKQTITATPQITLKIGTIYEQPLIYYTVRCVSARFLLTGEQKNRLQNDTNTRVSIKSLSLAVISQCVRLMPQVLQLQLEITAAELNLLQLQLEMPTADKTAADFSKNSSSSNSPIQARSEHGDSSHSDLDYEHIENAANSRFDDVTKAEYTKSPFVQLSTSSLLKEDNSLLLEIKDDHFGKSTCDHLLNQPLSRSADPVMLAQQVHSPLTPAKKKALTSTSPPSLPPKKVDNSMLSKSDIVIATSRSGGKSTTFKITEALADTPPPMLPPKPPKRTKSIRKTVVEKTEITQWPRFLATGNENSNSKANQFISDILLYFNHTDPMLRSGVQQIVGNFLQTTKAGSLLHLTLNLQQLLAILIKGLQDEIHTVIIHTLNAFDKIFPHILSKYLTEPPSCHYKRQQKNAVTVAQTFSTKQPNKANAAAVAAEVKAAVTSQDNARSDSLHVESEQSYCANDMFNVSQGFSLGPTNTYSTRSPLFSDNDELIDALLNTFQLQSNSIDNNNDAEAVAAVVASFSQATSLPVSTSADSGSSSSNLKIPATKYNTLECLDFFISPKLLLDKLRLCHHNKYWLVQNKYAEVISNLNYAALRTYYEQYGNANYELSIKDFKNTSLVTWMSEAEADATTDASSTSLLVDFVASDIVCFYETHFLEDLLQLIGDADIRVRAHAAECLCRFVIQNAKQHISPEQKRPNTKTKTSNESESNESNKTNTTNCKNGINQKVYAKESFQTNLNLIWDYFDYSIFSGLPQPMRDLFRTNATIEPPILEVFSRKTTTAAVGDAMTYANVAFERNFEEEEKVLSKVLYRMTNKLLTLNDKNLQFGIIYTLRLLLKHFNFVDFRRAWMEFNFMEICMKFCYYNNTTAVDLNCQCDLIDVTGKLMAGSMLSSPHTELQQQQIDQLLTHTLKIINVYFHLFTNQKPLLFVKVQKGDLFANARELAIVQSFGYFGNDYVYIKLYNILRSANDSYKITINPESGTLLMSLLKTCLNTLSLCLELRNHNTQTSTNETLTTSAIPSQSQSQPPPSVLKLIEEILQYLTKLINYAPIECIACLRQLLKYLFGQNYGNRHPDHFDTLVRAYFGARVKGQQNKQQERFKQNKENSKNETINSSAIGTATGAMTMTLSSFIKEQQQQKQQIKMSLQHDLIETHANYAVSVGEGTTSTLSPVALSPLFSSSSLSAMPDNRLFAELFASGLSFHAWHFEQETVYARNIKLFERLVIYCLTLFMKSNALVQAPILALLCHLLDLNVTYSILDSKNVIFEQILNNLELIESGNARNAEIIIPPMIKFLVQLTHKSDRKLITIPKIISITNNLLANSTIRDYAVLALKALTYEIFFISQTKVTETKENLKRTSINAATGAQSSVVALSSSASPLHKPIDLPPRAPFQSPIARSPLCSPQSLPRQQRHMAEEAAAAAIAAETLLTQQRELDTQKEVVMGMLEKFIDANVCQQVLCLLLLREQCSAELETIFELKADKILRTRHGTEASIADGGGGMHKVHDCSSSSTKNAIHSMVSILPDSGAVYAIVCRAMSNSRIRVRNWNDFFVLNTIFCNYGNSALADSKEFLTLLQLFITKKNIGDFSDLSYSTIILSNIILKTEEIYLVNHIKLFLKNQPMLMKALQRQQGASNLNYDVGLLPLQDGPSTSSGAAAKEKAAARITGAGSNTISEIKYFAKVLCEKLDDCLAGITGSLEQEQHPQHSHHYDQKQQKQQQQQQIYCNPSHYYQLAVRFVSALYDVCCRSRHKDALQSVFRMVLAETDLLDKYYNLLMMGGDITADFAFGNECTSYDDAIASSPFLLLQFELFKLLSAVNLLDPFVMLQQFQTVPRLKWNVPAYVRSRILKAIVTGDYHTKRTEPWKRRQQVLELCSDMKSVHFLIADIVDAKHRTVIYDLCQVDVEFCSLLLSALLQQASMINKRCLRSLIHLLVRISYMQNNEVRTQIEINAKIIAVLAALHRFYGSNPLIKQKLIRAALALFAAVGIDQEKAICESLQRLEIDDQQSYACFLFLNCLQNLHESTAANINDASDMALEQRIIDEKWLFAQLIKFSAQPVFDAQQLVKILLEIQSENKLHKIFENETFDVSRVLPHAITGSVATMLATFRNNCIQHNPHIHYMRPNPLARVAIAALMVRIEMAAPAASHAWEFSQIQEELRENIKEQAEKKTETLMGKKVSSITKLPYLAKAIIALMDSIEHIEATALVYIEAKFIEKFVREKFLQSEHLATLLRYLSWSCTRAQDLLQHRILTPNNWNEIRLLMLSISKMLAQNLIWHELNQIERPTMATSTTTTKSTTSIQGSCNILNLQQRSMLLCKLLDLLMLAAAQTLQHTSFYRNFKVPLTTETPRGTTSTTTKTLLMTTMMQSALSDAATEVEEYDIATTAVNALLQAYAPKAIFVAKLIETKIDVDALAGILSAAYITGSNRNSSLKCGNGANIGVGLSGGGSGANGCTSGSNNLNETEFESAFAQLPLHILTSIGISILRTNQFYAYAVTPYEIVQKQQIEQQLSMKSFSANAAGNSNAHLTPITASEQKRQKATTTASGKMPTIPVESLSDVDILRKFVKRLSIFGFTTRQQFEEYFMTFLLLINKVYDENMVDEQEQFHIKSNCLEAILELLITYKTFPIVGNKFATQFHHTTRWTRINCDNISLKKLHKVQLLIAETNVFYHPNLERQLATTVKCSKPDTIIGTGEFQPNQYDLNFIWQQMEAFSHPTISPTNSIGGEFGDFSGSVTTAVKTSLEKRQKEQQLSTQDNTIKNFRYFSKQSGIDFKSSSQLIFDVLMQLIEFNHYLVLPNLVKFTEICESRDQIKCIKDKALKLQETIPMDDTISHQHLIYLLCKTQAMLIPTHNELQQLCTLISTYLKSSHVFIRNATLQGLICLLECCSKTNTTIGKLSEELTLLRDLISNYINRHGIIDRSPIECSDTHTKLVWTLNYCLIEWTTKFVPQCHLLSNTIIAASNFLRKSNNEEVYLCILHGLERLVVIGNNGCNPTNVANAGSSIVNTTTNNAVGLITPVLRHKIEKLALDLVKLENEKFSIPALKLLLSCMYMGSSKQLENTELSNGIVQDDPEIIAQQTDKVDILLHCIKSSTRDSAWIYGQVLCQIIRDLVPPNEILTKVIKEFLAINQPHCDVIAMIVYQVFRCAIDSSYLQMLQDWLICSLPTFLALPVQKGVWGLSVIFLSASINLHLIKLFPVLVAQHNAGFNCGSVVSGGGIGDGNVGSYSNKLTPGYGAATDQHKLGQHEIALFVTAAQDFHAKLSGEQKMRFCDAFKKFQQHKVYAKMLQSL